MKETTFVRGDEHLCLVEPILQPNGHKLSKGFFFSVAGWYQDGTGGVTVCRARFWTCRSDVGWMTVGWLRFGVRLCFQWWGLSCLGGAIPSHNQGLDSLFVAWRPFWQEPGPNCRHSR